MAASTRARVVAETSGLALMTRETVPIPTPAARATSEMVGGTARLYNWNCFHYFGSASNASADGAGLVEERWLGHETIDAFGRVHVVCNNAGVAAGGGIDHISLDNWRWVIDVNLMGVLYGIKSFLPHIRAHGEGGHIVNTASMAGMENGLGFSPYGASKFAVVSMSEGLAMQLEPHGIGVSVLCPSFVRTRIGESGRNRPGRYGQSQPLDPASPAAAMVAEIATQIEAGIDPATVAARVLTAIRENELYIFTHPGMRAKVEARFAAILTAMDRVEAP